MQKFSDDARRMADAITLHAVAGNSGKWAVITLADGRPFTYSAYDTRYDAVSATRWNRDRYVYIKIAPDGMTPKAAEAFLSYARQLHDAGFRLPDPADSIQPDITMPLLQKDRQRQIKLLTR